MWNRAELKNRAKEALKRNYWKAVLVGLLCVILGTSSLFELKLDLDNDSVQQNNFDFDFSENNIYELEDELSIYDDFTYHYGYDDSDYYDYSEDFYDYGVYDSIYEWNTSSIDSIFGIGIRFMIIVIIVFLIAGIVGILLSVFIFHPLEVGASRFFLKNLEKNAQVGELGFAFDTNYKNIVNIMFFRSLYTVLWSLLFIIPGIVKSYEYQMIPYLLAENPSLTKEQAFAISKQMMDGQKWKAFVLDFSFIGWYLLSTFTLGLLPLFYVNPYVQLTYAALYQELSRQNGRPAFAMPNSTMHHEQWVVNEDGYEQEHNNNIYETNAKSDGALDESKDSF